jgi:copper chaperone
MLTHPSAHSFLKEEKSMTETIIICVMIGICTILAVRGFLKTLRNGCCGGGSVEPPRLHVADKDPSHYPYKKVIVIGGIHCRGCVIGAENALNSLGGVYAKVDAAKNLAVANMKDDLPDKLLREALEKAGFTVTDIHK